MKKIFAVCMIAFLLVGCVNYRYRPYPQKQEARTAETTTQSDQVYQQRGAQTTRRTVYTPGTSQQPRDLFFTFSGDVLMPTDFATAGIGFDIPQSYLDLSFGMGVTPILQVSAWVQTRVFLRDSEDSPFLFINYRYVPESQEVEFSDDYYTSTYIFEEAQVVGYGFGYRWAFGDYSHFVFQIGYHNLLDGGHMKYVSGDTPDEARDLFDKARFYKPGGGPTLALGIDFRF